MVWNFWKPKTKETLEYDVVGTSTLRYIRLNEAEWEEIAITRNRRINDDELLMYGRYRYMDIEEGLKNELGSPIFVSDKAFEVDGYDDIGNYVKFNIERTSVYKWEIRRNFKYAIARL